MNGRILAACLATLALVAAVSAAPATRLEKAVDEVDLAFRAAAIDEVKAAASQIEGAVAGGNGGGFLHSIMKAFGAPWKMIFGLFKGKSSSSGSAGSAIAAAENLVNKLQRRRRAAPVAPEARLEKALAEADVAFRTAVVDEMKKAEQSAVAAIGAGNGGGFLQSIMEFLGSPFKLIAGLFKGKSSVGGIDIGKLESAVHVPAGRRRRSPDGSDSTGKESGDSKSSDNGSASTSTCKPTLIQSIMKMFGMWKCPSSAASSASKTSEGSSDSGSDKGGSSRRRRSPDGGESSGGDSTGKESGDSKSSDNGSASASTCKPTLIQSIMKMFGLWKCPSSAASSASKTSEGSSDSGSGKGSSR